MMRNYLVPAIIAVSVVQTVGWTITREPVSVEPEAAVELAVAAPAAAAAAEAPAEPAAGAKPQYDTKAFEDEWHSEWKNGDYPGYKITNPDALPFEDRQSDGKPGFLQSSRTVQEPAAEEPAAAEAPATAQVADVPAEPAAGAKPQYDTKAFEDEWHAEWKNGDYPGYKITNPDALPFEDRQSDGKPGFLQGSRIAEEPAAVPEPDAAAAPAAAVAEAPAEPAVGTKPQYDTKAFEDEWHGEWKNGDYPGYKITNPDALPFEDRQSDGKPGFLQGFRAAEEPAVAAEPAAAAPEPATSTSPAEPAAGAKPQYDTKAFEDEWHAEWKNGDYPGYKITNPDALPFEDRQSDGKPGL